MLTNNTYIVFVPKAYINIPTDAVAATRSAQEQPMADGRGSQATAVPRSLKPVMTSYCSLESLLFTSPENFRLNPSLSFLPPVEFLLLLVTVWSTSAGCPYLSAYPPFIPSLYVPPCAALEVL